MDVKYFVIAERKGWAEEENKQRLEDNFLPTHFGYEQPTLEAAKAEATRRANRRGQTHFVAVLLGAERPVFDVEIGWEKAE